MHGKRCTAGKACRQLHLPLGANETWTHSGSGLNGFFLSEGPGKKAHFKSSEVPEKEIIHHFCCIPGGEEYTILLWFRAFFLKKKKN